VFVAELPGTVTRFTTRQPFPVVLNVKTASCPAATIEGRPVPTVVQPTTRSPAVGFESKQNGLPVSNDPLTSAMLFSVSPPPSAVAMWML
jgi:hypothetical protein